MRLLPFPLEPRDQRENPLLGNTSLCAPSRAGLSPGFAGAGAKLGINQTKRDGAGAAAGRAAQGEPRDETLAGQGRLCGSISRDL